MGSANGRAWTTFQNPRLVVTFRRSAEQHSLSAPRLPLPKSTGLVSLATSLKRSGSGGKPTAVMPSPEEFKELARRVALKRPTVMTEWQFARVMELYKVGGDGVTDWTKAVEAGNRPQYERLNREILATPPRYWKGWSIQDDLLLWYLYRDLLPAPVQDHIKAYWEAWLMPNIPTRELFHPQSGKPQTLAEDQGLARAHVLLSGRIQFCRRHPEFQSYGGDGGSSGRQHHWLGIRDGRRASRPGALPDATVGHARWLDARDA